MHGLNIDQARNALSEFITECQQASLSCIIVIHGKGINSTNPPILKNHTQQWLKQLDAVMAFCSAQIKDGGTGAVYVLLRNNKK